MEETSHRAGEVVPGLFRARTPPVSHIVLGSPACSRVVLPGVTPRNAAHPGLRTVARSAGSSLPKKCSTTSGPAGLH